MRLGIKTRPPADTSTEAVPAGWRANLARVDQRRAFTLLAIGAIGGLALAGFGLFSAKGTTMRGLPAEDIALVNQQPILTSDFVSQVETTYGVPFAQATQAQKKKILHDMIREELYVQRGLELGFPSSDPDTRNALVAAVEQQVVADVTTQNPTEAELAAYYQRHRDAYASEGVMTVTDLRYPASSLAAIQALVAAGRPAAQAPGGVDTKRTNGEEFYFAAKIHLGDRLFEAARKLGDGQSSPPIVMPDGVHVLVMQHNSPPVPLSFADAREQVLVDYKRDAENRLQGSTERFLRDKADIITDKAYAP
jgi:hypothetical protein